MNAGEEIVHYAEHPTADERIDAEVDAFYLEKYLDSVEEALYVRDLISQVPVSDAVRAKCASEMAAAKARGWRMK